MQLFFEIIGSLIVQLIIICNERLVLIFVAWPAVALLSILPFHWLAPGRYDLAATAVLILAVLESLTLANWAYKAAGKIKAQ